MSPGPALKIKLQLYCGSEIAMGPGKADLLEAIGREGSIAAAARALGLSYRRAWQLVETMNRCWSAPLVETRPGSARSGARVTDLGGTVLAQYRALQQAVERTADRSHHGLLAQRLLPTPRQAD